MSAPASSPGSEDLARGNYVDAYPPPKIDAPLQSLKDVGEDSVGNTVKVRAWIQNARMQGAKMAFVELREERSWTMQGVVIASSTGTPVNRQMVKWLGRLQLGSFISVEALSKKPVCPYKAAGLPIMRFILKRLCCEARGPEKLG